MKETEVRLCEDMERWRNHQSHGIDFSPGLLKGKKAARCRKTGSCVPGSLQLQGESHKGPSHCCLAGLFCRAGARAT